MITLERNMLNVILDFNRKSFYIKTLLLISAIYTANNTLHIHININISNIQFMPNDMLCLGIQIHCITHNDVVLVIRD